MLSNLTNIPRVMRSRNWANGARLLESWFSRPVAIAPTYGAPDTTTVRMDSWVLTYSRARDVYDQLVRERIWSNAAARVVVASMLRRKGMLTMRPQTFGRLADPVPLQDPDYINQRPVGNYTTFDDLTAALGHFNLRVLVAGTVAPSAQRAGSAATWDVQVNEIGVYVFDSFDFQGDQYLGCWSDNPDGFSPVMPPSPGAGMGFFDMSPPLFTPVGNRDFREWRNQNGRGGDYLVFSDLKRLTLNPPDRFVVN